MRLHLSRALFIRLTWVCLLALLGAACARTPIQLPGTSASATPPSGTDERTASLQEVVGTVEVKSSANSPWAPAKVGDRLTVGSGLRTAADSRALIQFTEGSRIRVEPGTTFAVKILNPYLDSLLTSLDLQQGKVWVLLNGGALDVETPVGIASARAAYLSADFDAQQKTLVVTCLQGTCSFGDRFIPSGSKLAMPADQIIGPEPMTMADYGAWGSQVPEATQLAWLSTEAVVQGSATLPVVATATPSRTPRPSATATPPATASPLPSEPSATPVEATTVPPTPLSAAQATATVVKRPPAPSFTPFPPAPIMGPHVVQAGDTLYCIARAYGVTPIAIAQANGLFQPFTLIPGQVLKIPEVQWVNPTGAPVCPTQFASKFPGLPATTSTVSPLVTPTPAGPLPLTLDLNVACIAHCGDRDYDYTLHIEPTVTGGKAPYNFKPDNALYPAGTGFDSMGFGHCTQSVEGQVTVTDADGQKVTKPWVYYDTLYGTVACPTPIP